MVWVDPEALWLDGLLVADEVVGGLAFQGLQPAGVVVGGEESIEMAPQLVGRGVVEDPHRGLLDGAVHPLDLPVRPSTAELSIRARRDGDHQIAEGVVGLGQSVLDAVGPADAVEGMHARGRCARRVGELDAVVGEHRVDAIGHGLQKVREHLRRHQPRGLGVQLGMDELRGPIASRVC